MGALGVVDVHELGYWEAWALWWLGQTLEDAVLWNLPVLWWARIGKLLQFAGGVVVVLDLLGAERLRSFGAYARRLRQQLSTAEPGELVLRQRPDGANGAIRAWVFVPAVVAGWLSMYVLMRSNRSEFAGFSWPFDAVVAVFLWTLYSATIVIPLALIMLVCVAAFLYAVQLVLIGIASTLLSDQPAHSAKWFAFFLVVVGFHFDLLGS